MRDESEKHHMVIIKHAHMKGDTKLQEAYTCCSLEIWDEQMQRRKLVYTLSSKWGILITCINKIVEKSYSNPDFFLI